MSVVSCVRCGAAMGLPSAVVTVPAPRRTLVAVATLVSQLLGTAVFALGLVWVISLHVSSDLVIGAIAVSALLVFAGGHAHRGGLVALVFCAAFDLTVGLALVLRIPTALAYTSVPMARVSGALAHHHAFVITIAGACAVVSAVACVAALPQARRFAAWQREQLQRLAHVVPEGFVARLPIAKRAA